MTAFIAKVLDTADVWVGKGIRVQPDIWNHKAIRNYGVYNDYVYHSFATLDGRLPERRLWENNQPGFLRPTPHKVFATAGQIPLARPTEKEVAWDGTWNMPLEDLADPKHKDAKSFDFIYQ